MPSFDAAILIIAFKSRKTLPGVIEALGSQSVRPKRVRVLENGSPESERIKASDLPDWVEFVESEDNLGFSAGNNRLASGLTETWIICLNPDAFPDHDWIKALRAGAERFPNAGLFGSTQYVAGFPDRLDGAGDVYHFTGQPYRGGYGKIMTPPDDGEVFAPCGAASMIRRDVFEALGGYDEDYFCYCEDVDLGFRARLNGEVCIQLQSAQVNHVGYGSSGRRSDFVTYHSVRNRLWTYLKNMPLIWLILLAPFHILLTGLLWVSSARFGQFLTFTKGLRDGLMAWPSLMDKRKLLHQNRKLSAWEIARMINWDPRAIFTRQPDVRHTR